MFLSIGKRTPRKKIGFVADYCAVCRDVRVFSLRRVGSGWHINFIPLGPAKTTGHEVWCETCGASFAADTADYASVSARPSGDAVALAAETSPTLMERCRERFDFDDAVLSGTFDPALRPALLREPFELLNHSVHVRMKSPTLDRGAVIAFLIGLLALGMLIGAVMVRRVTPNGGPPPLAILGVIIFVIGLTTGVLRVATGYRRYLRAQAFPALVKALAPLDASLEELKALRRDLKRAKVLSYHALEPKRLRAALERR